VVARAATKKHSILQEGNAKGLACLFCSLLLGLDKLYSEAKCNLRGKTCHGLSSPALMPLWMDGAICCRIDYEGLLQ
jgi:hypothetical protein